LPKGEQKEAAVRLKDVAILPIGFAESLMYQIFATAKEMQMVEMWLFSLFLYPKVSSKKKWKRWKSVRIS